MKIAYEYSIPNPQLLTRLGLGNSDIPEAVSFVVTAYDGEEPIGIGFMQQECSTPGECRIQVLPAYGERQIDRNILKLLQARSGRTARQGAGETMCV